MAERDQTTEDAARRLSDAPPSSFLFCDLAGFSALTEAHGDRQAAELVLRFVDDAAPLLDAHGAELLKTIGDELMLRVPSAGEAIGLALRLVNEHAGGHGLPALRIGGDHGSTVTCAGDHFGRTVNVAARLASEAEAGQVLVTERLRAAAGTVEGATFEELGSRRLRHLEEPVRLIEVRSTRSPQDALALDPVCRMAVDPASPTVVTLVVDGVRVVFCSHECAERFAANPERYSGAIPR